LEGLSSSPKSVAAAVELEHSLFDIFRRELSELEALDPPNAAFRAGLAYDRALLRELDWILERPDFVRLSLTLPDHPELTPSWLKRWLARSKALQAHAREGFSEAGVPGCANLSGGA
jgi:hypothetical protein